MIKPLFLRKTYFPKFAENRMKNVGDVEKARDMFLRESPSNLAFLLKKRYEWMNGYIDENEKGIEIGCGTGLSKLYIRSKYFVLTDYASHHWVEKQVNAVDMPFEDSSLDFIVSSNMIHHLARPLPFFEECARVLKAGGRVLIQEINASLIMRVLLKLMKHEGYSYEVNVFDKDALCNDPDDLWSANCAIPNLLFDKIEFFENQLPFKIVHHRYTEVFLFPLSGGVIAKRRTVNLPVFALKIVDKLDDFLIFLSKSIFPLQRQIVLKNMK